MMGIILTKLCLYCIIIKYLDTEYRECRKCQKNNLKQKFKSRTCGDEKVDNLIQKWFDNYHWDTVFEYIPYNKFVDINCRDGVSLAIWEGGPLQWDGSEYTRNSDVLVVLKKFLYDEILNKIDHLYSYKDIVYGISQNPDTKDYIMVFNKEQYFKFLCKKCYKKYTDREYKWCKSCQENHFKENFKNWTSRNEQIDNLIQKMQLKIYMWDTIFEWIPYNQLTDMKGENELSSAIWRDGPLIWNKIDRYARDSNKTVALKKCPYDEILNEMVDSYHYFYNNHCFKKYGISQNPNTKIFILILEYDRYFENICKNCVFKYTNVKHQWCILCQINYLKENFTNWITGNEQIDNLIKEMQLKIDDHRDIIFEWIPYNQFDSVKEIGKGGFSIVYSAKWKDGPLYWNKNEYVRDSNKTIALKHLVNSQNVTNEFLNEVKAYSINKFNNLDNTGEILKIYGISQNPNTKDYIMVLQYARGGNFNNWLNNNYKNFNWAYKLKVLNNIITGLKEIHQKRMIHHDLHTGNILFKDTYYWITTNYISDMGLCGDVDNIDETKTYGVMPYVAPEGLRGNPYTQAADIYSFGMIMYFIATDKQPFSNRAHDGLLALDICKGIRPEINEPEAPKCYIDLMKKCWDSNPFNRLNVFEVEGLIKQFYSEVPKQFKVAEEYRLNNNNDRIDNNDQQSTHPQAIYTSRLLNPFTDGLDCAI
ncbi:kinase-like domain-containing protein [Rhizophagus clarus]|uniref:Kinase-like domain-containing protein n=1 Tax=Rhizophagus clarus TaxID=94130 RepID=A0A8H3MA29_9GLOM|nr:kinase-like domain-containing protein [Rhizophagus clarus]